jgi:hypothetical protein
MTKKEQNAAAAVMSLPRSIDAMIARYEAKQSRILSQLNSNASYCDANQGLRHSLSWVIGILADLRELRARAI